ncbi:hypothetical protein N9753_01585 [Gammaproteobacteria bacterium]|nr:hypothetical protein [Gammaproteobacteria bacterium]MDB4183641.1 hypothetical protein [Gammaproteobacteria bacterium]
MEKVFNISIILPEQNLSQHSVDLINWCFAHKQINLACLIWSQEKNKKVTRNIFWKLILMIERAKLKIKKIEKDNIHQYISSIERLLEFRLSENENETTKKINCLKIDLHIALAVDPLFSALKNTSKNGILCLTGETLSSKKNSPYFFDEVLQKINQTKFKIIHFQPKKEKVMILKEGAFLTHGYFLANQENILLRQNFYLQRTMELILQGKIHHERFEENLNINKPIQAPSMQNQLRYVLHLFKLFLKRLLYFIKGQDVWNVALYRGDWRNMDFNNITHIKNPKNHFLADPFVITKKNQSYCFVEDFDIKASKGLISVYEIGSKTTTCLGIALKENFHLSFPYLFECESKTYMLPETSDNKDIRIYEAVDFPLQWKLCKIIKKDIRAVDSMIFQHNNLWWLFSNINPIGDSDCCSELSLFYTDHPIHGQWIAHPNNPIVFDPSFARNGGIILEDNCIYRVGQNQSFGTYGGGGFSINKIIKLTPDVYEEESSLIVKPNFFKGNKGAHHFHSNGSFSAFDFLT